MKTLLLIDDDAEIISLISQMLSQAGYRVVSAQSEDAALALVTGDTAFDAAIVDFWLGTKPALSVLDALAERRPGLPIMVVSGGGADMPIEVSHSLSRLSGAVSFLQKPFQRPDLLSKVEDMIAQSGSA